LKTLLTFCAAVPLLAGPPEGLKWIAHRGGVVDARYSENSPASLEAAVEHGYWMIESDIRETSDGAIITHHDPDFRRFYNDSRRVVDTPLSEVRKLRAKPGGTPPMTIAELVQACRGRLHIMLDVKDPEHTAAFYQELERQLRSAELLDTAYVIGLESAHRHFKGKARVSITDSKLRNAVAAGEDVGRLYFLFEWGKNLTPEMVRFAQRHKVPVVPSINTFHYGGNLTESLRLGGDDVRKLIPLGVTEFQIDSVYEPAFR
jgi:glycerophosphoryl diester phosphodiesterase